MRDFAPSASEVSKPQPSPDQTDLLTLIRRALSDADKLGRKFTLRGFCRQYHGLGGRGRDRLQRVVEEAIADGKLKLVDGVNANGVAIKYLAL